MKRNVTMLPMSALGLMLAFGAAAALAQAPPTSDTAPPPVTTPPPDQMGHAPVNDPMHKQMDTKPMQEQMGKSMAGTRVAWNSIDVNRDGFITKDELSSYPTYQRDFAKFDTNGDGKLSKAEWAAGQEMEHRVNH
ncbi:MAG: EF-hand domain-containing protein [Rhodanobacteraceae bacterium]